MKLTVLSYLSHTNGLHYILLMLVLHLLLLLLLAGDAADLML